MLPGSIPSWAVGTPTIADSTQVMPLRVYLAGANPAAETAAALSVSNPRSPAYARYLTPTQFAQQYGPDIAQTQVVTSWLTAQGMTVTATTQHYIAVDATVAQADAAFAADIAQYELGLAPTGAASVPAALAADVATVTGLDEEILSTGGGKPSVSPTAFPADDARSSAAPAAVPTAATTPPCSQYWGQYTTTAPEAYGQDHFPTTPCGYTVTQMREAYGVQDSPDTGAGATIAVVLDGGLPSMQSDANAFFAAQGVPGFAPGQYSEDYDSTFAATCGTHADVPEEPLDVETAHIIAPAAKVVYVGADCGDTAEAQQQDLLDAQTRVVDQHLADVTTDSFSILESAFTPAEQAAWELIFKQGALEGIGFDFDSGDGGDGGTSPPSVTYPASDPWATAVGGTSLLIGATGAPVGETAWGDNFAALDPTGDAYATAPPGEFSEGSTGGPSAVFAQPAYQAGVVPPALATENGATAARRVTPDLAADAGGQWMIGYTGAVTAGAFGMIPEGGTSGASPIVAGLEADAKQAAGHAAGFLNPALYALAGTSALNDILPVNPADPPAFAGEQFGEQGLITLGEDSSLQAAPGFDDATGVGSPGRDFVAALGGF